MAEINPTTAATQLATAYTQGMQSRLDTQSKNATALSSALGNLRSALQTFDSALTGLSAKKGLQQFSTAFSATGFGSATATASAQPGTYSLFVEQLASAHQVAFEDLPAVPATAVGTLAVSLGGGASFNVDFAGADTDGDTTLSQAEIARAINLAAGNGGQVNAMLVTVGGHTQLVLAAASTGAAGQISLDTSAVTAAPLKTALDTAKELSPARDAIVWLGAKDTGVKLQQASNTFTAIPGVSMTVTQAQASGAAPLTLTVAGDNAGTAANVRTFVDAYNALNKTLDQLTDAGSPEDGKAAAAFASDASVRALRKRLNDLVHQQFGGLSMLDLGIKIDRNGTMILKDEGKLQKTLLAKPDALDSFFGSTGITTGSGVLGSLDKYLQGWLSSVKGQIKQRQNSVQNIQKAISARQARLDNQYSMAYERYLKQFTKLQQLQSQMSQTNDMFASLPVNQTA